MTRRFNFAHYGFLALAAFSIVGCNSDRTTAPSARDLHPRGADASLVGLASTPALYDQDGSIMFLDGTGELGKTSYLADDFVIPAGAVWKVTQVGIVGKLVHGSLTFSFRADAGGQPGAVVPNTIVSLAPSTGGSQLPGITNYIFTLPTAITLPAGKYWLSIVTGTPDGGLQSQWQEHAEAGSPGVGSDDGGVTWQSRGHDYVFGIFGTVPTAQTITFATVTPNPATVGATATLDASASSGLDVTLAAGPPSVCTLAGKTVSFVGIGKCTLTANQAGNGVFDAAAPVTQTVNVGYHFDGFLDPVKNGDVLNSAKAGQAISLKWRLTDANGAPITTLSLPRITVDDLACSLGSTTDQLIEQAAGNSGLQNLGNGYYQYNWKTPGSYAKSCKLLQLDLGEGTGARMARFAFTK